MADATLVSAPEALRTLEALDGWNAHIRDQFPILAREPESAYLDSCATAQKPQAVLDAVVQYLTTTNANVGRGSYTWANQSTGLILDAEATVKNFLGDRHPDESSVHFVSGTSQGLRSVALDWLADQLDDGDEIIVPFTDHQANTTPWLELREVLARRGVRIVVHDLPCEGPGVADYDVDKLADLVNPRTKFVAATHVHHVYGEDLEPELIRAAVGPRPIICIDAAQSVGHLPLDVDALGADIVVFSGHKAMALPGTGVVWARNAHAPAYRPGGWQGTPNTAGIVSVAAALDWLTDAGVGRIEQWTTALTALLTDALASLPAISVLGCQDSLTLDSPLPRRKGIVTFRHRDIPAHELGFIFAARGLMVRSDSHCQASRTATEPSLRISTHAYTTVAEIERVIATLQELK